ncbi:contact-dependent growth inhibition system immunity protein [Streptomyces sp. NPDC004610]|uniref:contact-dependent growth inhibition system immunity protein n=1 Tax=unclassified Streptomyces TaxID=2593676 RepID=UPI0033A57BAE
MGAAVRAAPRSRPRAWNRTRYALRRRPIGELSIEDMHLLIGQDMGLALLLPLTVTALRDNPMAECDMYAGDLPERSPWP